jgi:hypothetical protein
MSGNFSIGCRHDFILFDATFIAANTHELYLGPQSSYLKTA